MAEELQKPILTSYYIHSSVVGDIWGEDLPYMQLINKFNKGFGFSLCVTDIYSKYAWLIPLKDKIKIKFINAELQFQKICTLIN